MQVSDERRAGWASMLRAVRQRPVAAMAAALVLLAMVAMTGLGVVTAPGEGVFIERGETRADAADDRDDEGVPVDEEPVEELATVVVDVSGAVTSPVVVELPEGARVGDAIEAAGGLAGDADISALNRAAPVTDGMKVAVPRIGEAAAPPASAGAGTADSSGAASASGEVLVNINSADAAALQGLPGVGPSTAQAIVDDRTQNGPFVSPEDLMRVSGIGEKKFAKLQGRICV